MELPLAQIGREIPSFGGFYREGDTLVGLVTDAAHRSAVEGRLWGLISSSPEASSPVSRVAIRDARYSFAELATWRDLVFDEAMGKGEVVSLDLDERYNRIDIGIADGVAAERLRDRFASLGIPVEALNITRRARMTVASHSVRDYSRPVQGGYEVTTTDQFGILAEVCSLGFNAKLNGKNVVFTNSHCTKSTYSLDGGGAYQDAIYYSKFLGYEYSDPGPTCGGGCRWSDAAAFRYQAGVAFDFGYIARTIGTPRLIWAHDGPIDIDHSNPRYKILVAGNPYLYETVDKIGRSSGWTRGEVLDTCEDFQGTDGYVRKCSVIASYYSTDGDSGAPVFRVLGSGVKLVGINWGFDDNDQISAFSPMGNLYADFGSFTVYDPPLNAQISGEQYVKPYYPCEWFASATGGVGPYTYQWSGVLSGSGQSISGSIGQSGSLMLTVTDSNQNTDSESWWISVSQNNPECPL
jgi:hypothetical protein